MKRKIWLWIAIGMAYLAPLRAEDIELFTSNSSDTAAVNVLFVIDNSANWNSTLGTSTKKALEKQALTQLLGSVTSPYIGKINVGLMSFAKGNSPNGSKIISKVAPLTLASTTSLYTVINAPDNATYPGLTKTNNAPYALSLHEAYLYFKGQTPRAGTQDTGTYDTTAVSGGRYISPSEGTTCVKNYIIFIGNGSPDSGEQNESQGTLSALGGIQPSDPIALTPSNYQSSWTDEYSRFLYSSAIETYVLDVYDTTETQNNPWKAARSLMKSTASKGAGSSGTNGADHYFAITSSTELLNALTTILDKLQAVNSVFAATALPVSVNVRGTYLNQVYMGVFRPDADLKPLWRGNLKQYQLAQSSDGSLFLADQYGAAAQDTLTGFVTSSVTSYWTHSSNFFQYIPSGDGGGSDAPDGEVVEKGGVGQRIRDKYSSAPRTLYTCTGSCTTNSLLSSTPFNSTNVSTTALGVTTTTERDAIINWMKGLENITDENGDLLLSGPRVSVHADVLHSRPAVVNYNNDHKVVIYYGTNDGSFHAVRGGQTDTFSDGTQSGDELWSFVPSEYLSQLKTMRNNAVMSAVTNKPYFADGPVTALVSGSETYVYFTQRRGGRFIYALDVSDPTAPRLKWKKSSSDWPELGTTWSEPLVVKVNLGGTVTDALIFGAGYDEAADDASPATTATMGRGIFVVNARTGELIFEAGPNPVTGTTRKTVSTMTYSIPSDITAINRDNDANGTIDRAYVGDTGGNIWRLDLRDADPSNWTVHKLAALGSDQKFLFSPDVVYGTGYDAILIGAGDREKPFDTSVTNAFYMIKDTATSAAVAAEGSITTVSKTDLQNTSSSSDSITIASTARGWYFTLGTGEKTVSSALTASGTTYFSTNQPSEVDPDTCSNLGIARIYKVDYADSSSATDSGQGRSDEVPGGGYIPSPTYGVVQLDPSDPTSVVEAVIMGTNVETPASSNFNRRVPTYWFRDGID